MNALYAWIERHPLVLPTVDLSLIAFAVWEFLFTVKVHGVVAAVNEDVYRGSHAKPGRGNRKRTFGAASPTHDGLPNLQTVLSFARSARHSYNPLPSYNSNYDRQGALAWN
jgi:hypothetical protein